MSELPAIPRINLAVAHMPEAKPLLAAFDLRPVARQPFPLFANQRGVQLIVSGNGKLGMGMAVAYLAALQRQAAGNVAWLNIGLAGHGEAAPGSGLLINKIEDRESGQVYYPTPLSPGLSSTRLISGDVIETRYADTAAYDMEGSGFWQSATRFAGIDFVQLFKIVSDNPRHPVQGFDVSQTGELISGCLQVIGELVEQIQSAATAHAAVHSLPQAADALLARWHFTRTQHSQLQALLRRWQAYGLEQDLATLAQGSFADARALLQALEARLLREEY